jgi:N-acetyl-gamma-glutamyl-phosphate reductase
MKKIRIGVVGATSLTANIMLQFLGRHPQVELTCLTSETRPGEKASSHYKFLKGKFSGVFIEYNEEEIIKKTDVVFLAKQHGEFVAQTISLFKNAIKKNKDFKIIDLSADFRLKNPGDYEKWYSFTHPDKTLLKKSVYGLPELYRKKIKQANLVANPGCYPTSVILGLAPFLAHHLVDPRAIIVDAYSGTSGAGMRPNPRNMAITTMENILPYKIGNHQHTPEMEQELSTAGKIPVTLTFVPHVVPFRFGMLSNIYCNPVKPLTTEQGLAVLKKFYFDEPFVRVLDPGEYPEIRNVVGTNWCELGYTYDPRTNTGIVLSVIDNVVKGASGQAIQNMNIMLGWDETTGLL